MITEKTISTWMLEFSRIGEKDESGAAIGEYMVKTYAAMMVEEPMMIAALANLFANLKIENPLTAAIMSLSIYHECRRRQDESDRLGEEVG